LHQALYRKWRPQTFEDVYGQEHITSILKYETENTKFSHAYLFCGSRGTGKTTCAKILSKAVNCESPVNGNPCNCCPSCISIDSGSATDVLEMDAASNNGVENIRDIRDEVVYTPSALKYRVYIVDEVHMLSGSAFNALLKTLEEPPTHVVFILATTELHKLPSTIISRCQRFDFRRINVSDIMSRLAFIASKEGIEVENDALRLIAKYAQGGMRDAISLFELCAGNNQRIDTKTVENTIGSSGNEIIAGLLRAVHHHNYDLIFSTIDDIIRSSKDISVFWNDMISYCRDLLVVKTTSNPIDYLDLTENEKKTLDAVASDFTKETILYFMRLLNDSYYAMQKAASSKRNIAEMTLIRMCDASLDTSNDALLSRISKLEAQIASGASSNNVSSSFSQPSEKPKAQPKKKENVAVKEEKPLEDKSKANSTEPKAEKLIRGWPEICDKATASNVFAAPWLKMSKGYMRQDGSVVVKFPSDISMNMFLDSGLEPTFRSALSFAVNSEISERMIEYVVSTNNDDGDDFADLDQN